MNQVIINYKKYLEAIERGYDYLNSISPPRVIVCSLLRNSGEYLDSFFDSLVRISHLFDKAYYVFYENDSSDDTVGRTKYFLRQSGGILSGKLISEKLNRPAMASDASKERSEHMAYCRNKYLEYVRRCVYDYVIVLDSDLYAIDPQGLVNSFGYFANGDVDVMASNGLDAFRNELIYYDLWSHVENNYLSTTGLQAAYPLYAPPRKVQSAFGGMAIYRMEAFLAGEYSAKRIQGKYGAEHVGFHFSMAEKGYNKIYMNPAQTTLRLDEKTVAQNDADLIAALKKS